MPVIAIVRPKHPSSQHSSVSPGRRFQSAGNGSISPFSTPVWTVRRYIEALGRSWIVKQDGSTFSASSTDA